MYGLDTSPRDWGMHRTDVLSKLRLEVPNGTLSLQKSLVDSSVWYIMVRKNAESENTYQGWLAIYVDDFLGGSYGDLVDRVYEFVNATWECGELERVVTAGAGKAVRFDGLELQWSSDRTKLFVHQASYATDLVNRYEGQFQDQAVPLTKPLLDAEPEEEVCPEMVRKCQQIIGELLYLSVRTRPDLSYVCSRLAAVMTKRPRATFEAALGTVGYVASTAHVGLIYTVKDSGPLSQERRGLQRHGLLEVYTDADFAPECSRSQESAVVLWRGLVIHWTSSRQAFVAQSTCEAELVATVSGANMGQSFIPLIQEIRPEDPVRCQILNDNTAAIGILVCDASSWRTRHLRIRASALREKIANFEWEAVHTSGEFNIADAGTKVLSKGRLDWLKELMGLGVEPGASGSGSSPGLAKRIAGSLYALVLAVCTNPVDGVRDHGDLDGPRCDSGDWALVFLLGLWTIAVIALWEGAKIVRRCCARSFVARGLEVPDPEEEPPPEQEGPLDNGRVRVPEQDLLEVEGLTARVPLQVPQGEDDNEVDIGPQNGRGGIRVVDFEELRRAANRRNQHGLRAQQRREVLQAPPDRPVEPEEEEARGRFEDEELREEDVVRLAQVARDYLDNPPNPPLRFSVFWRLPEQCVLETSGAAIAQRVAPEALNVGRRYLFSASDIRG